LPNISKSSKVLRQPDYSSYARFYDYFELAGQKESKELNVFLAELFKINDVKSIIDFACGTGAQSIGLARAGFVVTACDLNREMLEQAKIKAQKAEKSGKSGKAGKTGKLHLTFKAADMREADYGQFDAGICIFNAIGHLTREDCRKFFANAFSQLNPGGLLVVDILNFPAMAGGVFKEYKYMSRESIVDGMLVHHVRNCTLSRVRRQIRVRSVTRWQDGFSDPGEISEDWQMQIYDADELQSMLLDAGFSEIQLFGPTGNEFSHDTSDSILAISQKK